MSLCRQAVPQHPLYVWRSAQEFCTASAHVCLIFGASSQAKTSSWLGRQSKPHQVPMSADAFKIALYAGFSLKLLASSSSVVVLAGLEIDACPSRIGCSSKSFSAVIQAADMVLPLLYNRWRLLLSCCGWPHANTLTISLARSKMPPQSKCSLLCRARNVLLLGETRY